MTEYLQALAAGSTLSAQRNSEIAAKLHTYTGLPADYVERRRNHQRPRSKIPILRCN